MQQTIQSLVQSAVSGLTETQEHTTKPKANTARLFADWLGLNICDDPELMKLAVAVQEWCVAVRDKQHPRWLSLIGRSGTGKTHCATRVWKWLCSHHRATDYAEGVKFIPKIIHWPSFVMDLRSGTEYERIADMRKWPFLVIDEIGAERDTTGFSSEHLATLLSCRVGRWTVITSNLTMAQFESLDVRIASRMGRDNGIVTEINTIDYSLRKQP